VKSAGQVLWLSVLLLASTASVAHAQIDPNRRVDWSQVGIPGGIPSRTVVCATLSPGASVAQINTAIANCPSGQVVKLTLERTTSQEASTSLVRATLPFGALAQIKRLSIFQTELAVSAKVPTFASEVPI